MGPMLGESQEPVSPGKRTSPRGRRLGLEPNPCRGERGESGRKEPKWNTKQWGWGKEAGVQPTGHQGLDRRVTPFLAVGKGRMNRAGEAGDRDCQTT